MNRKGQGLGTAYIFVFLFAFAVAIGFAIGNSDTADASDGEQQTEYLKVRDLYDYPINAIPICDDGIVCYQYRGYNKAGMSCFRDQDLVEKYCGGKE